MDPSRAIVAGAVGQRLGLSRTFSLCLLLAGGLLAGYARSTNFAGALAILLVAAVPLAGLNTVVAPIVMRTVPRELLGRVYALLFPAVQVMSITGVAVAGWLTSSVLRDLDAQVAGIRFGTYDTVLLGAAGMITLAGVYAMFSLRGTDAVAETVMPANAEDGVASEVRHAASGPG